MARLNGQIVRMIADKGFAFIRSGTEEYFMHASAIEDGDFLNLVPGTLVSFEPRETPKGLRAEAVTRQR